MLSEVYYGDCLEYMRTIPDKHVALALVDPPYFSGPERRGYYGSEISTTKIQRRHYPRSEKWSVPGKEFFDELMRVSRKYVVFGCNYFDYHFHSGRIVWDKCNGQSTFSDCELAATNLFDHVRMFKYMWNGMMQGSSIEHGDVMQGNKSKNEFRIHPTQKPVALYGWILKQYAPDGLVLDTHLGSGSSRIAAYKLGFDFIGCEWDKQYYDAQEIRFQKECLGTVVLPDGKKLRQGNLFD